MTSLLGAMQVVPILRAGLVLIEQISTVLPSQVTYHVGLVRNEETLQVIHSVMQKNTTLIGTDRIPWSNQLPFGWGGGGEGNCEGTGGGDKGAYVDRASASCPSSKFLCLAASCRT